MKKSLKKISRFLIVIFLVILQSGCEDFLIENDPSNFTTDTYYKNQDHAVAAVNAIYGELGAIYGGGYNGAGWMMLEFATGLADTELSQAVANINVRSLNNTADNNNGQDIWTNHYKMIANANLAIKYIPDIEMNESLKINLLAEARFLRAYHYYNLVRIFGSVPLITNPVDLGSDDFLPIKASIEDVYNQIVEDLTTAEASTLPIQDTSGRVSMGAIKSLLSSVYLTMAGYPLQKGDAYYQLAREKSAEVISFSEYDLFQSYEDLRDISKQNTGEHIFMVQFHENYWNNFWYQSSIIPFGRGISQSSQEIGGIKAQDEFVESYEAGDLRAEEKQFYFSEYTLASNRDETIDLGGYWIYKYFEEVFHLETSRSNMNWSVIRYAEVLLIFAEAENEISGPTQEAYNAVNRIRQRATLPQLSGLSQSQLREAIWKERFHELSYEMKTWFDMVRVRKAFNVLSGEFEDYVGHSFVYGPTLTERELLFPIPSNEIRNNQNLTQNPGY